jgi:hypothetical protein
MSTTPGRLTTLDNKTAPAFFSDEVAEARRFYLDLCPDESQPLVVVCGGREHCTPDYAICRDTFPFYSFEYVARGRGEVKLQGRSFALQPGRVLDVFPPNALQPLFEELIETGMRVRRGSGELCVKLLECLALRIAGAQAPGEGGRPWPLPPMSTAAGTLNSTG